jgi:uncharacterized protein YodC (DUF2158 family)
MVVPTEYHRNVSDAFVESRNWTTGEIKWTLRPGAELKKRRAPMNGQKVRVKKGGKSGTVVSNKDGKFEVQFFDGQAPYRLSFSEEELEFLPAYDARRAFEKQFTENMDEISKPFTGSSEKLTINPKSDKKDK